jgi:hypothetical protein
MIILQIIGIIIGVLALYLLIVTFAPGFTVPEQPLEKAKQPSEKAGAKLSQPRKDVTFQAKGTIISAWLYLPEDLSAPVPCIIMGNGFGGTKGMIMEGYDHGILCSSISGSRICSACIRLPSFW